MSETGHPLLVVRNLEKHFPVQAGVFKREVGRIRAVDGISFSIEKGETFGLVGESGCGKSTAAKAIMHLIEPTGGEVIFDGKNISGMSKDERRGFRRQAQMIFQDPESSFDPRMTIGESVAEPLRVNGMTDRERRRSIVEGLLERVGLDAGDADRYPHEFSGGQKQRIGLARALSINPELLVADEPVSALDVSIQAEILSLMEDLQREFNLAILIISHNLGVIRQISDAVGVMYVGELVERGPTEDVFGDPAHPYTRALLSSIPRPDPHIERSGMELTGDVPSPSDPPPGCRFHTRCPEVIQPDGLELDQTDWRTILTLADRVYRGDIDPQTVRESVLSVAEDGEREPEDVTLSEFEGRLREDFDIQQELEPTAVDTTIHHAIEALYEERPEVAAERLQETFATPCRDSRPASTTVEGDQVAACHLLETSVEASETVPATGDD